MKKLFPEKKRPIENLTLEELEYAIKEHFGRHKNHPNLFQKSIFAFCLCDHTDKNEFLKLYMWIIEQYLKSGVIKVEDGKILYKDVSSTAGADAEYEEVSISCPYEFIQLQHDGSVEWVL